MPPASPALRELFGPGGDPLVGGQHFGRGQFPPGQADVAGVFGPPPDGFLDACGRERRLVTRTRERYAEIRGRLDAGESLSAISRITGLDRQTVQRFARAGSAGELLDKATSRESKLDQFTPDLHRRWNEGVTGAAALHAELREQGWTGSEADRPPLRPAIPPGARRARPAPPLPKTRQIIRWLLTRPDHIQAGEQARLEAIRARCPHINALAGHVTAFAEMMTARTGSRDLEPWLAAVEADDQSGLRSLAVGIRNDQQAPFRLRDRCISVPGPVLRTGRTTRNEETMHEHPKLPAGRRLNVVLRPGSPAHYAYYAYAGLGVPSAAPEELAAGFQPRPELNLQNFGGKTITDLIFVNNYLGGQAAWDPSDISSIDDALSKAMSDSALQSVMQQYFDPAISSQMPPSAVLPDAAPDQIFKDQVEAVAAQIFTSGALGGADPASTVINIMLPRGVVLVDGFSPGFQPPAGQEAEHQRRLAAVVKIDDEDADSKHGLGGYHGSVHVTSGGSDVTVYYAVGVYSEGDNGIPVFDQSWKNVVATFYHELNEARTDADVEDVNRTNNDSLLGWYSPAQGGGEIGDIPINEAGAAGNLSLVFQEINLADGTGTVPVQLMWSNKDDGPASHVD